MKKNNKNNIVIFDNYNHDYIEEAREILTEDAQEMLIEEDFDTEYEPSENAVYSLASDLEAVISQSQTKTGIYISVVHTMTGAISAKLRN